MNRVVTGGGNWSKQRGSRCWRLSGLRRSLRRFRPKSTGLILQTQKAETGRLIYYVLERREMINDPEFRKRGWQIDSGPTESRYKSSDSSPERSWSPMGDAQRGSRRSTDAPARQRPMEAVLTKPCHRQKFTSQGFVARIAFHPFPVVLSPKFDNFISVRASPIIYE
jgi:hypothetical protein